jgi:hypothetical protein
MRYEADPQAYAPFQNPLQAVFSFPCGQTAGFAKGSNPQYGSSGGGNWPRPDEDVFLFAQSQGWHATDPTARWYYNTQSYDGQPVALDWLEVLVTGRTICTAYVYTDLTAHFASPDGERHAAGVRSDKNCATAECSSTVSC